MPKYRKKPIEVDAFQWDGANVHELEHWADLNHPVHYPFWCDGEDLLVRTLEGEMRARPGDWIICGVKGEYYPCKPDIFDATYEPVR